MSIKQTEVPEEDLLLLLPAAAKWLSGDTYELGKIVPYAEFKKSFGRISRPRGHARDVLDLRMLVSAPTGLKLGRTDRPQEDNK